MELRSPTIVAIAIIFLLPLIVVHVQSTSLIAVSKAPVASFTYTPEIPAPGDTVFFNASASYDPDGWIVFYTWDFGDGNVTTVTVPTISYSYPLDGTYTVELKVTDNSGLTSISVAVVEVSTEVYFRVCFYGTLTPMSNVEVTMYYYSGSAWVKAPVGCNKLELRYDNMTQPDLADTPEEKYRNPGFTASILRCNASNIGFDIHPSQWEVFFKFKWGDVVTYWPNDERRVYTYNNGVVESHDYSNNNKARWDSAAGTYVIKAKNIPRNGVSPSQRHPIIVSVWCPPPPDKYYLTVRTDPSGVATIPGEGLYYQNTNVTLTAPAYVDVSENTRYRFRYWDVDGVSKGNDVNPIVVNMNANHTATAHYVLQYAVCFSQTGLLSDATGTVVTVAGSSKTLGDLPFTAWVDSGSSLTYSYTTPVTSSVAGKRYRLSSVSGSSSPITVTAPMNVTGNFVTQYLVTFAQTGLDSTATGTVVTVNGSAKTYANLPYSFWADCGDTVTYTYSSTVASTTSGKRFALNSVTGPASPITVTGPTTVTGNYVTQYQVTFAQTGLDSTATGTVVTVNGTPKTYSNLPYTLWVNSGSSVTYSYSSPVSSSVSGKQFRLGSVSGPASPITVSCPTTVTGNYVTQYLVTFAQTGLGADATGTVVTVNGSAKTYTDLPYSFWVDCGSTVVYAYTDMVGGGAGKRYRLDSVTGPSSPVTVTGPATVTGNYVTQYSVTFAQNGLDSTAVGTVVTVNGEPKQFGDLPFSSWVDSGSSVTYAYSNVSSSTTGKRFTLTSVSGPSSPITVTSAVTVTGNYVIQYLVTFYQSGVGTSYTGTVVTIDSVNYGVANLPTEFWWNKDSSHSFAFLSPLSVNASTQYVWNSTSGLTTLQSGTLIITTSGSVTGNYVLQNCVTFDVTGVSSDYTGTVVTIDGTPYSLSALPVSFYWQLGSTHSFAFQSPLIVTPNGKQYVWTSTSGLSTQQSASINITGFGAIIGHYKTQYYLTLATNPPGTTTPSGSGWYDDGAQASISTSQYVPGGSRWRFVNWTTDDMSEIADPYSPSTMVLVDKAKTVTAYYIHQYFVCFRQTGLEADATGTVVTVDGVPKTYSELPFGDWYDEGTFATYSYTSIVPSSFAGKRFILSSVTGPSSPIQVFSDINVTGNYVIQYYLNVTSPYGTPSGQGWYNSGSTAYASLDVGVVDHGNGTRHVFTNWNGDASGTNYAQSNPILMTGAKTAVAVWKTQHLVTFTHSGLDSSASSTVVTVNGVPKTYGELPCPLWVDNGGSVTYSYYNVSSSTAGKRFILTSVTGLPSPVTVTAPATIIGNYKTQYQITFAQSGVGSDFTGAVVSIDGTDYTVADLPQVFWWDSGSTHPFSFYSPLVVNISRQYLWVSTTGLSSLQSGTLTVTTSGSVTGNYNVQLKYLITFDQTGVGSDFSGTVVTIDGADYTVGDLPVSFWWTENSVHDFAYQSPLLVSSNVKRYLWVSTSGLSSLQSGSITVTASGSVTGNYKTQYYLTLATNPPGITSPSGAGWYDANTYADISTDAFVVVSPNSSRYRFNGWTTEDMAEITDPTRSPTTVLMDKGKTVTANYVMQYYITFDQTGISSDFTGTVVTIDSVNYPVTSLPYSFWWDQNSAHNFAFQSPLEVATNTKRYLWVSTSGLSSLQSGSITVTASGSVTGNYKTQYY
ncbi:MAG: PKD domain-containing protein, partial [Candidatus Bathyarchaeia archaeon]